MTQQKHDILIYKRGDALAAAFFETLLKKGFSTNIATDQVEVLRSLRELKSPILIADCGEDPEHAYSYVKELIEAQAIHSFPTIIVGAEVDGYEGVLGRYFKIVATLGTPCGINDLLEALTFIIRSTETIRPSSAKYQAPSAPSSEPTPQEKRAEPEEGETNLPASAVFHDLYRQWNEIPDLLFKQFDRFNLIGRSLGGGRYAYPVSEQEFRELGLLPIHERTNELIAHHLSELSKWSRNHTYRVALFSAKILEPLVLTNDALQSARAAALLYSWTFGVTDRELLRRDYQGNRALLLRKDLCSKLKDSAMKLAVDHSLPDIGQIIATMGRIIGREEIASDNPTSLIASAIVTADLVDRICFNAGCWDPHAAYALLRRLKSGKVREIHPASLACAIKVLSEAISSNPKVMLSRKNRVNPALQQVARETATLQVGPHERRVAIDQLTPGMRLTRPVLTFDGKRVLTENILLDEDLIWRIWQLAAIRPINGPITILAHEPQ